jgi:predicted O-methyltransferase YrrM
MESHQPPQYVSPGHFYSPISSIEDIERAITTAPASFSGIDLREDRQLALLEKLSRYYAEIPFPENKNDHYRYAFNNPSYSWCDAIILYCMVREVRPARIIEVGSGHTSALLLDTNERHFNGCLECTFIEPYPKLLHSLLKPADLPGVKIIERHLQDVDLALFTRLQADDILFIDSSHVAKAGSDLLTLFFEVLPRLNPGTLVHFHDVFNRFEYPAAWLREGRAWNEQYILRAFLQFNSTFHIRLFTPFMISQHPEWFRDKMPNCLRNTGGHIWITRTSPPGLNSSKDSRPSAS